VTPVDDITVEEEGLEHQLFFQAAEAIEPLLCRWRCNGKPIDFYLRTGAAAATVV
jgi:hypothetical protein